MPSSTDSGTNGRRILVDWANGQDHWVRGLVGEVLSSRKLLTAEAVEHFYEFLLQEKELTEGEPPFFGELEDGSESGPMEDALILTKIKEVENVNALVGDQEVGFNPGLTVLYGENGAGKTGYVRILKTVASVRNAEAVISNVLKTGDNKPSATICYRLGMGEETTVRWKGEQGVRPLTRIDVFDSYGILLHVDGDLTYVYTPGDLALFRIVNQGLEAVKQHLEIDRKKRLPEGNPFLSRFSREAPLYSKIESLGPSTNLAELEKLAVVSNEEEEQLLMLRERVEALRGKATADKVQLVREELALYRRVNQVLEVVGRFAVPQYVEMLAHLGEARRRYSEVSQEGLGGEEVPQILDQPWRDLVESAERYIRATEEEPYPAEADVCVYCRQPLEVAARQLLQKYRAFCNNEHQMKVVDTERAVQQLAKELLELDIAHLTEDLTRRRDQLVGEHVSLVLLAALDLTRQVATVQESLGRLGPFPESETLSAAVEALRKPLEDHLRQAEALEQALSSELADRGQKFQEELPKLRMLEARITLRELIVQIRKHVEDAQWADMAGLVSRRFQSMFKSLTDGSKVVSEQLLNQDFEARFREECRALMAPEVSLEFPGRKGEPARRKSIAPRYRLSDILSEGEQKVIALADFLAEATLRRSASPIVFDDPVNSLDYKRLSYVVGRIVELSRARQVVVFTHNIWFTMELLGHFEKDKAGCSYYDVSGDGEHRGIISPGNSPRLDSWGDKKTRINALIDRAKKEGDKGIKDAFIEKAYEDLRGACEIVVEQDLLQKVVQSYSPNVMVGKLRSIKVTELPAAIEKVNDIFERCCRFIGSHKQPLETLSVRPTIKAVEEDWLAIQNIHKVFKSSS